MSQNFHFSDVRDCAAYGLVIPSTDLHQYYNQKDIGDTTEGSWFVIIEEPHVVPEQGSFLIIYSGSFGNYNSPGAETYTYADLYDVNDEVDMRLFRKNKASLEAKPEWLEEEEVVEPREVTYYAVIKVKVRINEYNEEKSFDPSDDEEVMQFIGSGADYDISIDDEGVEIIDTEFEGMVTSCPI